MYICISNIVNMYMITISIYLSIYIYIYVYMYMHMYILHIHTHIHIYIYIHTYIYTYTYIYIYIFIYRCRARASGPPRRPPRSRGGGRRATIIGCLPRCRRANADPCMKTKCDKRREGGRRERLHYIIL